MDSSTSSNIAEYLRKLCITLSSDPDGAYELAVSYLSSTGDKVRTNQDERLLCQKVHSRLSCVSIRDADKFTECYQKIKNSLVLKQRSSILALLFSLSETLHQPESTLQLFPTLSLNTNKSGTSINAAVSATSKNTLGSVSWGNATSRPQTSNLSLHSEGNNMANVQPIDLSNERTCVREAVLAATGVRPRSHYVAGSRPMQMLYARIAHLGVLHNTLKEFIDPSSGLMPQGLMGEGLVSSIKAELAEYYRSVALLQSQTCEGNGGGGTLRRVCVWAQEPLHRLTWLNNITHASQHKKGGELASCVHRFVRHGDERVALLARRLLTALTYPLLVLLTRWLLHGVIDDPFNEFFIECRSTVGKGNMWHERYRVRQWMVPSFMSHEQASQILATGKSVVFMREACADELESSDHAHHLQALLRPTTGDEADGAGATWWEADGLRAAVCSAHETATHRLLAALTTHHHLLDHLAAHRRYLLLAQGDFAHHLMTLVRDELDKPAQSQYVHNLSCTLEAAVRATNAQFEPSHVLSRLYVNLFAEGDVRPEDSGWDMFVLQYRVEEPLDSVFHAQCQMQYRALFLQLWRIKRIEYNLHEDWRQHAILHKRLKFMPEVWGLMRRVSCLRAEALRMCGALQEGCFVGAEATWAELFTAVAEHRDLDTLLHLHSIALERQSVDALIHRSTEELQSYLRNVLGETLALHSFEATLRAGINAELERRDAIETLKAERFAKGEYAFTAADEAQDKEKRKIFNQFLANRKADLNVWGRTYRGHVSTLILKLALHEDVVLQTLAFRLDYSDFYKRANSKLHEPLTYQHKRLSEIGLHRTKHTLMDLTKKK